MTALQVWGRVPLTSARVNHGRWIADCPLCRSALGVEQLQRSFGSYVWWNDAGTMRKAQWIPGCWDCGAQTEIVWPDAAMVEGVERLLAMRPQLETRNWHPGETLLDLARENAEHGIFSGPQLDGLVSPGRELLVVEDGRIRLDRLPATRELTAPIRPRLEA